MSNFAVWDVKKAAGRFNNAFSANWTEVEIGTCFAVVEYGTELNTLLFIENDEPGNGDFKRMMDYLEWESNEAAVSIEVIEIWNKNLEKHLINKRGYKKSKKGVIKLPAIM